MISALQGLIRSAGWDLLRYEPGIYNEDWLRTRHGHDFETEPAFEDAYNHAFQATIKDPSHHGRWRVHIAIWAAKTALRRQGDFVECGVARAFVSTAIMKYVDWNKVSDGRFFYLVDTYEGIIAELRTKEEKDNATMERFGTRYQNNYPDALKNISQFKNAQLIKGAVPEVLPQVPSQQIAYLHLDMNSALAEEAALKYFWPKMVLGGVILFDDFTYVGYESLRAAHKKFAKRNGVDIAYLPTGQGLLIK